MKFILLLILGSILSVAVLVKIVTYLRNNNDPYSL